MLRHVTLFSSPPYNPFFKDFQGFPPLCSPNSNAFPPDIVSNKPKCTSLPMTFLLPTNRVFGGLPVCVPQLHLLQVPRAPLCRHLPMSFPSEVICLPSRLFRKWIVDLVVPPLLAGVVVAGSDFVMLACELWDKDHVAR